MIGAIKLQIKAALIPSLYFGGLVAAIATVFKKAEWGLLLLIFFVPQPNLWYKFQEYPMGKDFIDILFFSALLGIIYQKKGFAKTTNSAIIFILIIANYLALWRSSFLFSLPAPVSTSNLMVLDFKNYVEMVLLYYLAVNILKDEDLQKKTVVLMAIVMLIIAIRSYRNFTPGANFNYDKRAGGPFEAVGLNANHYGAFIVDYIAVLLGIYFFDKNPKRRLLYMATILFSLHPLFYAYSRGAYLASFVTMSFLGIMKKRSLLVLAVIIFLSWQVILPSSVAERIIMTETPEGEIEHSAAGRLLLWGRALKLFKENPVLGIGFGGYGLGSEGEVLEKTGEVLPANQDVHSFYLRTLCEQGIIGFGILMFILYRAFRSGWGLYKLEQTPFKKGLGLGFMACVISLAVTNIFGDRWSYSPVGSYFWILWGMVDINLLNPGKKV